MSDPPAIPTTRLDGKVALVTGSGRGLGRQNALELASRGALLVLNYSRASGPAEAVVAEIEKLSSKAIAIKADVSKPAEIAAMFKQAMEHYGHIEIVVSNSGVETFGHISEITPEEYDRVFSINTKGQLFVAQQAYHYLTKGGRLVMLSSISAQAKGVANHSIYSGSKGAVEAFARCLAVDFGGKNITVNAIAPGGIKTDMYAEVAREYIPNGASLSDEEIDQIASSWSPLKRPGYPTDVSRVVAFLCSEDAGWINGQVITIGGGASM